MAIAMIDRITSGHHVVAIERTTSTGVIVAPLGRAYRWRCSCDRCSCDRGCRWKASEANVRWGAERHIKLAAGG